MLPSWRDEVRIALCPDRVILARVSRRWRPRVTAKQVVRCADQGIADWKPCVEALLRTLPEARWKDADATVIVSNHFVRYALVPWSEELVGDDEKLAWVRHHFVEVYGEAVATAEYRWSEDRPDAPCLASAVDGEFVDQVRRAFEGTSLRLRSIQPYLMTVFNRWGRRAMGNAVWILAPEPGRVCLASIVRGRWRGIASRKMGVNWQAELPVVLDRELVLSDDADAPKTVFAYVPEIPRFEIPRWNEVPLRALALRALPGFSPHADAEYAMALTGVA